MAPDGMQSGEAVARWLQAAPGISLWGGGARLNQGHSTSSLDVCSVAAMLLDLGQVSLLLAEPPC